MADQANCTGTYQVRLLEKTFPDWYDEPAYPQKHTASPGLSRDKTRQN